MKTTAKSSTGETPPSAKPRIEDTAAYRMGHYLRDLWIAGVINPEQERAITDLALDMVREAVYPPMGGGA